MLMDAQLRKGILSIYIWVCWNSYTILSIAIRQWKKKSEFIKLLSFAKTQACYFGQEAFVIHFSWVATINVLK